MAIVPLEDKKLFILPFPQHILLNKAGGNKLICNVVILPRNDPFDNLGSDPIAFARAAFKLKAWLVKGESDQLPIVGDHAADANYHQKNNLVFQSKNREDVFKAIATQF